MEIKKAIFKTNEMLAQCNFENGELVWLCSSSDLDLKVELKVTYVKGSQYPTNVEEVQIVPLKIVLKQILIILAIYCCN